MCVLPLSTTAARLLLLLLVPGFPAAEMSGPLGRGFVQIGGERSVNTSKASLVVRQPAAGGSSGNPQVFAAR
jgi:parvulin-like peptidyl-prolyl isomerase